ncbi:MAG: hypothetical protein H6834_15455 [Planctomycetes bacterium]|nr:hypothetical protein [Planctomycetota bacterium]
MQDLLGNETLVKGRFTRRPEPEIDQRIERDLAAIRGHVRHEYPDMRSLILVGGFGRGEGSVLVSEDGAIRPLNDYDLVLVTRKRASRARIEASRKTLARQLDITWVDIVNYAEGELPKLPFTLFNFDFAKAGTVLAGDPRILEGLPRWDPRFLPITEAEKLLFTRLWCFLGASHLGQRDATSTEEQRFFLFQQLVKALLAYQDAHLILVGAYHPSYAKRTVRFCDEFPEQEAVFPLLEMAREAKLRPSLDAATAPMALFAMVRDLFLAGFMRIGAARFGRPVRSALEYDRHYWRDPRNAWLRVRGRLRGNLYQHRTQVIQLAQLHLVASHAVALEALERGELASTMPFDRAAYWLSRWGDGAAVPSSWDDLRELAVRRRMEV